MGTRAKTTVELDVELLRRAKIRAAERGESLREVLERALRREVSQADPTPNSYEMPDARFRGGQGLNPEFAEGGWERIRDEIYFGRGA